ncbi:hypothetical protein C0991_006667 [Blastosporella zonata]|nr:hypothetical protein C0991_006667 [Blastosporella zonata]
MKCKELSKLPKAASAKYITTPGCTSDLFTPGPTYRPDYLDPTHPATSLPKNRFPNIRHDALGIKAFPVALLGKPEQVWSSPLNLSIETWTQRVQRLVEVNVELETGQEPLRIAPIALDNVKPNAIPMSVVNATSKKRTSNKKHIRCAISKRLKIAVNLIVTRGANVAEVNGKLKLVMDDKEAVEMSDKWISPGGSPYHSSFVVPL